MKKLKLKIQSDFDQKKILHWFTVFVNAEKDLNH